MAAGDGRRRVIIEGVHPEINCGRFPIKRVIGEAVAVEADLFTDGHDSLTAVLYYRHEQDAHWNQCSMQPLVNDRWRAEFTVDRIGRYYYTLEGWVDHFLTWRRDLKKRVDAGQDVGVQLLIGANYVEAAARRASGEERERLNAYLEQLRAETDQGGRVGLLDDGELVRLMDRYPDKQFSTSYGKELEIVVDPVRARFSAWYEFFPRSTAPEPGRHGTFKDAENWLPYVASLGFDVIYLPPIHPVGTTFRKGRNNALHAEPDDVGSPWAIGSEEGGHKSVNPALGTLEDFRRFVRRANEFGMEVALDVAFQCAPDHPYVKEHPEWFRWRPDNTIQYAENPPKKYQDIYPFEFECENWRELWEELKSVFLHWIDQGVTIFRVDNPHTKPFPFWQWCIGEVKKEHPETIFLAEAFTRPKIMYRLAKLGFNQSYTYFAWRNTKEELVEYLTELTRTEVAEFFRPNFWPNTPDILTEALQTGGRPAFMTRIVLAATLTANYGIYGPAYEHGANQPKEPGSEEYYFSEKYEVKHYDLEHPDSLRHFIARINRIRRDNPALQSDRSIRFHPVDNPEILCYSKKEGSNIVIVVVNLDPHHRQMGWIEIDLPSLGLDEHPYQLHDMLSDARYLWHGQRNYVELDPFVVPAHIFRVRRPVRTEHDFDYYM